MGKVKAEVIVISPARAAELLTRNQNNRRASDRLVNRYARDMAAGNWQANGSAIVMNGDGALLDGQHRLMACVESGTPFTTLLVQGVSTSAVATVDTGRSRKLSDVLTMRGEKSSRTLAAILRQSMIWGTMPPGEIPGNARWNPSHIEQLEFLERYPEARDAASIADRGRPRGMSGAMVGALALNLIINVDDTQFVDEWFRALMQGDGDPDSPAYSLWKTLVKWSAERNKRPPAQYYLALMVKAWNHTVAGDCPQQWRWRRAGSQAEAFPVPVDLDGNAITLVK